MKLAIFISLFSTLSWARPVMILGYFDAFGDAKFNNSERVAKSLGDFFKNHPDLDLRLCALETIFDKSYFQLETCLKDLKVPPKFILGLGESNCNLKIETIARNYDRTRGADNEGNERSGEVIIPGAPKGLGLNYPLGEMYCSLSKKNRKKLQVSNNAGSFVCNNLAYQFSYYYPEVQFGFIHVPAHNCRNLEKRTHLATENLKEMLLTAVKATEFPQLPVTQSQVRELKHQYRNHTCLLEFYSRTKGID